MPPGAHGKMWHPPNYNSMVKSSKSSGPSHFHMPCRLNASFTCWHSKKKVSNWWSPLNLPDHILRSKTWSLVNSMGSSLADSYQINFTILSSVLQKLLFLWFMTQTFMCIIKCFPPFLFLFFSPIIFSISIHTTQIYPGRHREFILRLIICLFLLLCVHAVMYRALARACNQSALPHNMPPVFSKTQHVLSFQSSLAAFSYLWSQVHLSLSGLSKEFLWHCLE